MGLMCMTSTQTRVSQASPCARHAEAVPAPAHARDRQAPPRLEYRREHLPTHMAPFTTVSCRVR